MVKLLAVFGLMALVSVVLIWKNILPTNYPEDRVSVAPEQTPTPETLGINTIVTPAGTDWKDYTDDDLRINLKFPQDMDVKREKDGTLLLTKEGIHITIVSGKISGTDTLNTLAEKDIDKKKAETGDNFRLVDTISPISIGSLTAITYSTEESSKAVTYFYIPRDPDYLLVTDRSDENQVSVSDNIIYSLVLR